MTLRVPAVLVIQKSGQQYAIASAYQLQYNWYQATINALFWKMNFRPVIPFRERSPGRARQSEKKGVLWF
jgi:hypothetical protein